MSSLAGDPLVLLDACVLVPIALCDTLLRLAEEPRQYRPLWSAGILDEVRGALVRAPFLLPAAKAHYRIRCMTLAFPEAEVGRLSPKDADLHLPDPQDLHVVAAARRGGASAICTANTRHFPKHVLRTVGLQVLTPDQFLLDRLRADPAVVLRKLTQQAADRSLTVSGQLQILGKVAPSFAAEAQALARTVP